MSGGGDDLNNANTGDGDGERKILKILMTSERNLFDTFETR